MHDPERYEDNKSAAKRDADEYVPELIKTMKWTREKEEILDYGCGAGSVTCKYFLPMAIQYNSSITAIDISDKMIEYANKFNAHPRIQYSCGTIMSEDFPLKDKQFDKIFSVYVFHFIKDYRKAFQNFYQILKPGGQFGLTAVTISKCFF